MGLQVELVSWLAKAVAPVQGTGGKGVARRTTWLPGTCHGPYSGGCMPVTQGLLVMGAVSAGCC